ncbi:MAG: energy transducer TonB [Saprospiraceae bacterium]|nr:energy transducer TonB [Saprospiraceae bacterium]
MQRILLLTLLFSLCIEQAQAQTTPDTTIYSYAESMPFPLFKSCIPERHTNWTADSVRQCAETQLLTIIAQNIIYPEAARQNDIQGIVATTFVVEPTGRITNIAILKDIGGGCGEEATRILSALDEAGLRWEPARIKGQVVRMRHVLPLRFRLAEEDPFHITSEGDTVYVVYDAAPEFQGGWDSLAKFVVNELEYPDDWADSCKTGVIEMALLIRSDGSVSVVSQLDYNSLGMDFQWQAIRLANRTSGHWTPARYQDAPVATTFPLRTMFKSQAPGCAKANERFDQAMLLADEGATLAEQDQKEAAVEKWTQALKLHPGNTELLYFRGTTLLELNRRDEACADWGEVKRRIGVTWFEQIRRLVCGW